MKWRRTLVFIILAIAVIGVAHTSPAADSTNSAQADFHWPEAEIATALSYIRLTPDDLALRSDGHLYFSDPPYGLERRPSEQDGNHVYHLSPDGAIAIVDRGDREARPNGIGLSPDEGTLYVAYTRRGLVRAFDLAEDGTPGKGREFARTATGADGMTVDRAGNLFVTTSIGGEGFSADSRTLA